MKTDLAYTRYRGQRYRLVLAEQPLKFVITRLHVKLATCGDPGLCVVAQALKDRFFHDNLAVSIGPHTVKIIAGDVLYKYSTSERLRQAILAYDTTRDDPTGPHWNLPPGEYQLNKYENKTGFAKLQAKDKANGKRDRKATGKLVQHQVSMETGEFHREDMTRKKGRFVVPATRLRKVAK